MLQRMQLCKTSMGGLAREESGQDLVEYALVAGVIALVAISSMKGMAGKISAAFGTIATNLTSNT
jgi:pilus assembly protein Flp/PilA